MLSLGFLLLADAASEGPAIVLDTCANRCEEGEFYNIRKFSCGCYEGCEEWNNCCQDKKDVCSQNNTQGGAQQAEEKPVDSCANRCEEDEHFDFVKFSCGCYATCEEWGDCCQDRKDVCSQNNTQGGAQDKTAEHVSAIAAGCNPYSEEACAAAAKGANLELGGAGHPFAATYFTLKGCFTYKEDECKADSKCNDEWIGKAFYGTRQHGSFTDAPSASQTRIVGHDCGSPPGSCANRCGEEEYYNFRKFTCGCYEGCAEWNDCCEDANQVCAIDTVKKSTDQVSEAAKSSCANRCGEEEHYNFRKFTCGCYEGCEEWRDCCEDAQEVCAINTAENSMMNHVSDDRNFASMSCADRCGEEEHYNWRKFACGCYEGCEEWRDCCEDAQDVCNINTAGNSVTNQVSDVAKSSCANRCDNDGYYNFRKFTCGCYDGCAEWNDCCEDASDVCNINTMEGVVDKASIVSKNSCANRCDNDGYYNFRKFTCGCYEGCEEWRDCCHDKTEHCGDDAPVLQAAPGIGGDSHWFRSDAPAALKLSAVLYFAIV